MVVLVDTSIWIDHIRRPQTQLMQLLEREAVVMHPFVIGELVLGKIRNFAGFLRELKKLPLACSATPDEVLEFIARRDLSGSGIGYVDVHLVLAAFLTPRVRLWTRDRRLRGVAERLTIAAENLD